MIPWWAAAHQAVRVRLVTSAKRYCVDWVWSWTQYLVFSVKHERHRVFGAGCGALFRRQKPLQVEVVVGSKPTWEVVVGSGNDAV